MCFLTTETGLLSIHTYSTLRLEADTALSTATLALLAGTQAVVMVIFTLLKTSAVPHPSELVSCATGPRLVLSVKLEQLVQSEP